MSTIIQAIKRNHSQIKPLIRSYQLTPVIKVHQSIIQLNYVTSRIRQQQSIINNIIEVSSTLWDVLSKGLFNIIGIDPLVLGIISSIMAILILSYAWKKIKLGD